MAPSIDEDAQADPATRQNMRVVTADFAGAYEPIGSNPMQEMRSFLGGVLHAGVRSRDEARDPWPAGRHAQGS